MHFEEFNLVCDLYLPNMTVCEVRKGNEIPFVNNTYLSAAREGKENEKSFTVTFVMWELSC